MFRKCADAACKGRAPAVLLIEIANRFRLNIISPQPAQLRILVRMTWPVSLLPQQQTFAKVHILYLLSI